jgi:Uma2 family endonuclease
MKTVLKLGPADHGRPLSWDDYITGEYQRGYQYELIDGKLYVSPEANLPQNFLERWLYLKIEKYIEKHPEVINYATNKGRVFVTEREEISAPEPDLVAYRNFPIEMPMEEVDWEDVFPLLVAEILGSDDPEKDLIRNVELYLEVPSIKEYWVIDGRDDASRPTLKVHRRHGRRWRVQDYEAGETYTTKLLPGFKLVLNPRR